MFLKLQRRETASSIRIKVYKSKIKQTVYKHKTNAQQWKNSFELHFSSQASSSAYMNIWKY